MFSGLRALFTRTSTPPSLLRGSFAYAIGAGGMVEIKGSGNPLLDAFHGIESDSDSTFSHTPEDYARAYKASVWAFKCVRTRARALSAIPLVIRNAAGDDVQHPLGAALSRRNTRLMRDTESDMLIFGRAFWRFGTYQGRGWLKRLNPLTMEIDADASGIRGFTQRIDGVVVGQWAPHEVAYFYDYAPDDDLGGVAPMETALNGIGVTLNISAFGEYFFKNGAIPSGILVSETRLSDPDKARIEAEWRRKFQGMENAHGTAILEGGRLTYQTITPPLADLAMVDLREEERRDICAAFDVPMSIAQAADPALYAAKQDYANFHTLAVLPELDLLVDTINTQIMPWYGVQNAILEADLNDVEALQEDRSEITTRNAQGVAAGYLSLNTALERESEEPLGVDYHIIGGKLVPKNMLDVGDLEGLRELGILGQPEQTAPVFPFMAFPPPTEPEPAPRSLPPRIIEQPPTRATVDIVVRGNDPQQATEVRTAVLHDTLLRDLARWKTKVTKRGPDVPFSPDYLPSALTDWVRADLLAWDGEGERETWIKGVFDRASAAIRAEGDETATPEEFEAYWRGIGDLFDEVGQVFEDAWTVVPARLTDALRQAGQSGAVFDVETFLAAQESDLIEALAGDDAPLPRVVLAGAARGNDLLGQMKSVKQEDLSLDWQIVDQYAKEWARNYAAAEVRGINDTTLEIFRAKISEWVESGGTLEDLAKYIEGDLSSLDIPAGWSPGKMQWAVSRERARLIAQTETTSAFHEGAVTRWEQAAVPQKRFRTQNDVHVDDEICRKLNNVITGLRDMWVHPETGKRYGIPAHPGCRCFAAPEGI